VNLRLLLDGARELLSPLAQKKSLTIVIDAPEQARATLDASQIRQVLMNLLMNAIHAMDGPGIIQVRLRQAEPSPAAAATASARGRGWLLEVQDEGAGIAADNLGKVFDPFFTTKPVGEGTGLGLSIVAGIVREHGGSVDVRSLPGQGSTFSVWLPEGPREEAEA
jgi:signal transduction histidine kinase